MCGSLCGCVILSEDVPAIRQWSPLYVMITVIVVMSEKVDTTITKGELSCNAHDKTSCHNRVVGSKYYSNAQEKPNPCPSPPLPSSLLLSSRFLSFPLLPSPFLSFPFLSFPFLSFPFLSCAFLVKQSRTCICLPHDGTGFHKCTQ